jgi:hypothetical protein
VAGVGDRGIAVGVVAVGVLDVLPGGEERHGGVLSVVEEVALLARRGGERDGGAGVGVADDALIALHAEAEQVLLLDLAVG